MTEPWLALAALCCAVFIAGSYAVYAACRGGGRAATAGGTNQTKWFLAVLAFGLAARAVLAALTRGHPTDIGTFSAWAAHAADGLLAFYSPGYFADYPPGYIYVLWIVGKFRLLFGLGYDSPWFMLLLKLPAIVADMAAVWMIYRLAARQGLRAPAAVAALYAFNPAVIIDSAAWGQVDGVLTVFILLSVLMLDRKAAVSGAALAAALLVKPQALIFMPLPLLWFAVRLVRDRDKSAILDFAAFAGAAVAVFVAGWMPFVAQLGPWWVVVQEGPGWVVAKYASTMASYSYASLNAFNLFALVGGNGVETAEPFMFLSYAAWGAISIAAIVIWATLTAFIGKDSSRAWYIPLFLSASVFVLSVKMHERYLFPALSLALCYFVITRDRRAMCIFAGLSVTQCLNMAEVLALSLKNVYLVPRFDAMLLAVSAANVLLLLVLVKMGIVRHVRNISQNPPTH